MVPHVKDFQTKVMLRKAVSRPRITKTGNWNTALSTPA